MTKPLITLVIFMLFSCITFSISTLHAKAKSYVQEACSVTRYQDLCIKSLASFSTSARGSPTRWARAGVSVTIREVKLVSHYLDNLKRHNHVRGSRNKAALSDCVECIQDTLDNLYKSLGVLRRLSAGRFDEQMNDVLTWLSAALTDEDTCVDGFQRRNRRGKQISRLCDKVQNVSYITSNALALVNRLATTGLQDVGFDP